MVKGDPYERTLRAIGQALEQHDFHTFDLRREGDRYLVRGETAPARSTLQTWLRKWQGRINDGAVEFTYIGADLERLEHAGRARRRAAQRLPDYHSLPNILRTVGAYLDLQGAQLLQLYKREMTLMLLYQTRQGHPELEERTIASFYDLSVRMYQKRGLASSA